MLLNPSTETYDHLDPDSRDLMLKTIAFFEEKGKKKLKEDDHERVASCVIIEPIILAGLP
jgi:acyl-CoA dehydrogenase